MIFAEAAYVIEQDRIIESSAADETGEIISITDDRLGVLPRHLSFIARTTSSPAKQALPDWLTGVSYQLDEIANLPHGWDSHGADAPDQNTVDSASTLIESIASFGKPSFKPHVAPTPSGGVQFHWEVGLRYFEIECVSPGHAQYYFVDQANQREQEGEIQLGDSLAQVIELAMLASSPNGQE